MLDRGVPSYDLLQRLWRSLTAQVDAPKRERGQKTFSGCVHLCLILVKVGKRGYVWDRFQRAATLSSAPVQLLPQPAVQARQ